MAEDIAQWLDRLGLGQYAQAFADNDIDHRALPYLTDEDLKELGLSLGNRRILLAAITEFAAETLVTPREAPETGDGLPPKVTVSGETEFPAERRQITVLFADLVGFTELSSEADPEQVHALLNRFFEAVDAAIKNYGGYIDKHIGDAVMGVFGAPVAHTNDPERAVRAALDIHRTVGELDKSLSAHIGIASGQVVASGTGSDQYREYTVTGDSVNLASRLTGMAAAGETLVSDAVQMALGELLDGSSLGAKNIKGIKLPVTVWKVERLRETVQTQDHPFVGRRREMRQFQTVLEDCLEAGLGQTIYIRGEAGIGKTRLVEEFQRLSEDHGFKTHAGIVLDFGAGEGRDAIRALVRSLLELNLGSREAVRAAAAESATRNGLIPPDHLVHLNDLLDLDQPADLRLLYDAMDNATRNHGRLETVAELVRARFGEAPLFLQIEDLHWANRTVLDHVAHLAETVADGPAILVMTSRIEGEQLDQAWRSATASAPLTTIDLGPLREGEASQLAQDFLDITSQLARACIERAGGNPLFLEQLLKNVDEGMADAIPGSIQSLVQTRVDRLQSRDRDALQAASVLGQRFGLDCMRHLVGQTDYGAEGLAAQSLIRPEGGEYLFTHALIRDGVYASLLTSRRRELHIRAADWFKDLDLTLYAEHLDWAEDSKAAGAYLAAAQQQRGAYRYERALQLVHKALGIESAAAVKFELACFQGELLRDLGHAAKSIEAFEQAHTMANTDEQVCHVGIGLAEGMRIVDRYDEALEALDRAQAPATEHHLVRELAQIHYLRGSLYFPLGNVDGCLKEHEQARVFARQANSPEHEARASSGLADAYYMRGRMLTASNHYQRCVDISRENGFGRIEVANLTMLGLANLFQNRLKEALEFSSAGAEAAAKVGNLRAEGTAHRNMGHFLYELGEFESAKQQYEMALALARQIGSGRFEANGLIGLGNVLAEEGQTSEAVTHLERSVSLCHETGITFAGPWALGGLAKATDDTATRNRALEEGEDILRRGCVGHNHFWFYRLAMDACLRSRDWDEVERYAEALEEYARPEPLPWTDFFIARGRALAKFGRGQRDDATIGELKRISREAESTGMANALRMLEEALAGGS